MVENETSNVSDLVIPIHHYLESWGDSHRRKGIYNLRQPVIRPLYGSRENEEGTRQWEHVLLTWAEGRYSDGAYLGLLKKHWQKTVYKEIGSSQQFSMFWNSALHDGFVNFQSLATETNTVATEAAETTTDPVTNALQSVSQEKSSEAQIDK